MKRRTTRTTDPLDGPIDFGRFTAVRRNAFAGAGEKGGPSLLALWEMPQLAPDAVMLRRGRPPRGQRRPSIVRSVRLPEALWKYVEKREGYDYLHHAEVGSDNARFVTDEITDEFAIVGPASAQRERLEQLRQAGVTQFNIYLMNGEEEKQLELYGPIVERESAPAAPATT